MAKCMEMDDRTSIQVTERLRKELRILAAKRDTTYVSLLSDMVSVFNELDKEKTVVSIPDKLAEKIKEKIKGTDFRTVSEFVTFVLRMILSEGRSSLSADAKAVKEKLKKLGYL